MFRTKLLALALALWAGPAHADLLLTGVGKPPGAAGCVTGPSANILITTPGTSTWTNTTGCTYFQFSVIAAGGGGAASVNGHATGGGGGSTCSTNGVVNIPIGGSVGYSVGTGGTPGVNTGGVGQAGNAGTDTWVCNATTNCASSAGTAVVSSAGGGQGGVNGGGSRNGGAGGIAGIGDTVCFNGGAGGNLTGASGTGGSGGGGAAYASGVGAPGTSSASTANIATNGGQGDNATGGTGGTGSTTAGTPGGNGGQGTEGVNCPARGGGGGGGGYSTTTALTANGGSGGLDGGGGAGGVANANGESGGAGGNGMLCIRPTSLTYAGPGDIVSGASAWYGLRAYTAAIAAAATQKVINLRNIGTNENCDVLVATSGALAATVTNCSGASGGASLATFCTGGCAVPKWYDQSGNARDVSQATAANQPTLTFSCIGSLPCVSFVRGTTGMTAAAFTGPVQPNTYSGVVKRTGSTASVSTVTFHGNAANYYFTWAAVANTFELFVTGGSPTGTACSDSTWCAIQGVFNHPGGASASILNINGTETTGDPGAGNPGSTLLIGTDGGSSGMTGTIAEVGVEWGAAFIAAQRTGMCRNEQAYYGSGNFGAAC